MSERPKFSISPDELTPGDSKQTSADMDPQASRFRVAKVDFSSTPSPGIESNDLPHFKITDELGHDIQAQKTFGRNTLETLPHIDHYRNLLSTTGVIKSRPTLLELHDLEVAEELSPDCLSDVENQKLSSVTSDVSNAAATNGGTKFGWIQGVLVRCVLNIFGVMLFLRLTWVVGQAGIGMALAIILLSSVVTTLTALSMSAISTNGVVKGGGAYYMISRSLGPEYGGAIGIVFSLANAVAVAMYVVGFAETIRDILKEHNCLMVDDINDVRIIGIITAFALLIITLAGMGWEAKAQLVLLVMLLAAIVNFIIGTFIPPNEEEKTKGFVGYNFTLMLENSTPDFRGGESFFSVFAIFFPAATGILAGANISGDLKDAQKSIPKGTLLAILLTTIVYLATAWMSGTIMMRDAFGPVAAIVGEAVNNSLVTSDVVGTVIHNVTSFTTPSYLPGTVPSVLNYSHLNTTVQVCKLMTCKYGLQNDMQAMQMVSAFGPITIAGIISATLSSALASLVSAPKVFQAVCKDKIFPGIEVFGRGYGKGGEPRLAYVLAFVLALACICIGELNAIAPLISNFFLMSYALVNYSCFDASLAKSPGWRPSFRYYSMWLSLVGAVLCIGVMFVINWWTALITFAIVCALYVYVHYRKPDINWGSSTQAHVYKDALQNTQKLVHVDEHVKNYRPQLLVLSGFPQDRVPLVDFCSCITRNIGLMICGHVILTPSQYKLMDLRQWSKRAQNWLYNHKAKSFYLPVAADSTRRGVQAMLQSAGLGKLRPNVMFMGFKSDWKEANRQDVIDYVNMIHDAFDMSYGVGILRLASGLDFSHLVSKSHNKSASEFSNNNNNNFSTSDSHTHMDSRILSSGDEDDEEDDRTSKIGFQQKGEDAPDSPEKENLIGSDVLSSMHCFYRKQGKGFIDVWWLFDDGGLTLLIPYLLSTKKLWKNCKLRVYVVGRKKSELDSDQRQMAALLSKFRIQYSALVVLPDIEKRPTEESISEYSELIGNWTINPQEKETEESHPWKISESELIAQNAKTYRHLRLKELLKEYSSEAKLIVMTLPVPRRGICSAGLYMSWLDTLTSDMPPILLLRGNQENVLTFYS